MLDGRSTGRRGFAFRSSDSVGAAALPDSSATSGIGIALDMAWVRTGWTSTADASEVGANGRAPGWIWNPVDDVMAFGMT